MSERPDAVWLSSGEGPDLVTMTLQERAAALRVAAEELSLCTTCGKKHELRRISALERSWADPQDQHPYRLPASHGVVDLLWDRIRELEAST